MGSEPRDLIIVGAGPSGLAVAIAADRAGLDYEVIEKGVLVNSIFHFPRAMTFFTTPDLLEIGGLPFVTPYEKPTQWEALRYYRRVADTYRLRIAFGEEVAEIRRADGGFALRTRSAAADHERRARNVVFATGYYDHPNRLGIPGEELPHVTHYYDEPHPWYRRPVVVVGGKNSAAIAALELCRAGATVTLVHRQAQLADSIKYWIKPDIDNRIKEGAVRALFETRVVEIRERSIVVERPAGRAEVAADGVFLMTGYRPDTKLLADVGVRIDPATLKPEHDPETLETNVPGLFLAGSVAAGLETSKIFIETGRFHGDAIVRALTHRISEQA
ncbi:MAG TPA: YpdA family putative bacillithiol disulfide reductase [Vicinamibacteria bacterium]